MLWPSDDRTFACTAPVVVALRPVEEEDVILLADHCASIMQAQ